MIDDDGTETGVGFGKYYGYDKSPSIFLLGVGYKVMPELEVMFSYNIEFSGASTIANTYKLGHDEKNSDKQVFGLGAEYAVMQELLVSAGISYKMTGTADENNNNPVDPSFDEVNIGAGAKYTVMPGLDIEGALQYNYYMEMENEAETQKHNRDAWVVAIGATYKAL